jgi:hypothetical protein
MLGTLLKLQERTRPEASIEVHGNDRLGEVGTAADAGLSQGTEENPNAPRHPCGRRVARTCHLGDRSLNARLRHEDSPLAVGRSSAVSGEPSLARLSKSLRFLDSRRDRTGRLTPNQLALREWRRTQCGAENGTAG